MHDFFIDWQCTDSCDENGICYDNLSFASEVLEAAGKGDLQKVKNLITSGILVNTTDQDGNTPLHIAAINNKYGFYYALNRQNV